MTRFERRLLVDTGLLGIALTILTVCLDRAGALKSLDLLLYDFRAKHFQHYRTRPTDQLMHMDIDDTTLDFVGNWPWPREKWAQIIDEIDLAGAKVVAMDVYFPQEQKPTIEVEGQPPVDHDRLFADALERFRAQKGRGVLIPLSININREADSPENNPVYRPIYAAMVQALQKDLELDDQGIVQSLIAQGFDASTVHVAAPLLAGRAISEVMFGRVKTELDAGHPVDPESLRKILLPRSFASGQRTDAMRVLENTLPSVQSFEALSRFTRTFPSGLPPIVSRDGESPPIPAFARAAAFTGFVDLLKLDDAKVRSIPLWVMDRGRLFPQMGMALACAQLGVSTNDLKLAPNSVTIPLPDGREIVIPVFSRQTDSGPVGMLMDIPWFGKADMWQTMYDWPDYKTSVQHMPMSKIWDVCKIDPSIEDNNRKALEEIEVIAHDQTLRQHPPAFTDTGAWNKLIADTLDNLPPGTLDDYKGYFDGTADISTLKGAEYDLVLALRNIRSRPVANGKFERQRTELRDELRRKLQDKAVLIGWIATAATDIRPTPLHAECPGVVVHGAIFNAIMSGDLLTRAPGWLPLGLTLFVGLLVSFASAAFPPFRALGSAVLVAAAFLWFDFSLAYDRYRFDVPAGGPPSAAVLIWSGCTLTRFIREQSEKKRITDRFRSYVDPSLVNYVLEHPEQATLKGQERELSVVFTDLQGFTSIAEVLKSETVSLLNEYLGLMEPVIRKNHGLVNKFLGDGIMFFFGAPEPYPGDAMLHAWAAVQTVVEMQRVMGPFNEQLVKRNLPPLKMRAGVSTGEMVVGDAGTPTRSDYTVLGDRVNFAARLESANKYTGTLILISDRTVELLHNRYLVRPIGRLQVVGKNEPVMTYEPLAPVEMATDEMRKLVSMTTIITESYVAQRFADCIAATHDLLTTFGDDQQGKFCALYRRLSMEYLRVPPKDFRGQIKLEAK